MDRSKDAVTDLPKPPYTDAYVGGVKILCCQWCGALVAPPAQPIHALWHRDLDKR